MRNILKSTLFLIILLVLVEFSIFTLVPKGNSNKYNFLQKAEYEILQEREVSIDVIFFGDSLTYSSINPLQIWNEYGYTTYDVAQPAYIMSDAYKNLLVAIDYQKPKILIMEGNMLFRDPKKYKKSDRIKKKIMSLVPIDKYHNNWKKIFDNDGLDGSSIYKGYKLITKTKPSTNYDYMKYSDNVAKFPEGNVEWLEKILILCEKNNIEFVLVSTPSQTSVNFSKRTALINLSKELGFSYLDLNLDNPLNIDWTKETKDKGGHLNYLGAKKVSHYMGNYLYDTNLLVDHRRDKKYASWNDAYEQFQKDYMTKIG